MWPSSAATNTSVRGGTRAAIVRRTAPSSPVSRRARSGRWRAPRWCRRVRVAPGALQRLAEEQALPAGSEEQRVDRADQEPHAKRLVAAVAQPHVHADGVSARAGLEGLREIAATAPRVVRTLAIARK